MTGAPLLPRILLAASRCADRALDSITDAVGSTREDMAAVLGLMFLGVLLLLARGAYKVAVL